MFFKTNCITSKNYMQQDYRIYRFSKKEIGKYSLLGFVGSFLMLYFFYHSFFAVLPAVLFGMGFCFWKRKECRDRRIRTLEWQFKDWITGAAAKLQAGYSIENAFLRSGEEMKLLYEEKTDIRKEIREMKRLLSNNITMETILNDLGKRSGSEDIQNFADVFSVGKRSGGNLKEMIESCCEIITVKVETEREIQTLIHGKKTEQRVMSLIPFGIILYIHISSPGYFSALYQNPLGIGIMTGCLSLYVCSVLISVKIMKIEV